LSRGKLSVNVISNVIYYVFAILINMWFTPYLIHHLGIAAYGIVPLALSVVSYLTILTLVLNAGVGRFITVNLEKRQIDEACCFFNTSLVASIYFIVITTPPCIWLSLHPQWFFSIPIGQESQAIILFICTVIMFMLTVISAPFEVATFCRNRFDIRNVLAILASLIRVVLVVVLFNLLKAEVWQVGVGIVGASLLSFGGAIWAWRKLTPELKLNFHLFSIKTLKEMTNTGGWIAISQIGTLLLLSIDLIVVNRLFGAEGGGRYSTIIVWSALIRSFGTTIAGVLGPTIISLYARNEINEMVVYVKNGIKYIGILLAIPIGMICGLSKPLLLVWLGKDFVSLSPLLCVMTFHLCINVAYIPLSAIITATNKVKSPGLMQVYAGILNLSLALLLAGPAKMDLYGVAFAGLIVLTLKNVVYTPIYVSKILKLHKSVFYTDMPMILFVTFCIASISWITANAINIDKWIKLILICSFDLSIATTLIWIFLIKRYEKNIVINKLFSLVKLNNSKRYNFNKR